MCLECVAFDRRATRHGRRLTSLFFARSVVRAPVCLSSRFYQIFYVTFYVVLSDVLIVKDLLGFLDATNDAPTRHGLGHCHVPSQTPHFVSSMASPMPQTLSWPSRSRLHVNIAIYRRSYCSTNTAQNVQDDRHDAAFVFKPVLNSFRLSTQDEIARSL